MFAARHVWIPFALLGGLAAGCGPTPPPPEEVTVKYEGPILSEDVEAGERVFNQMCLACHDEEGTTPTLPGLGATPGQVRMQVREGGGRMPSFGPKKLTDAELEQLLAYLQTVGAVQASEDASAAPSAGGETGPDVGTGAPREGGEPTPAELGQRPADVGADADADAD